MVHHKYMKDKNIEQLNELMEATEVSLANTLKECRQEGTYVPLDSIINILRLSFDEDEIKIIKEKL